MRRRRAFLLVLCLLMAALMLVLGIGFLNTASPRYNSSLQIRATTQARALAMAGIEDARVKIQKDPLFPPPVEVDAQSKFVYSYRETLTDQAGPGGKTLGSYVVTIDETNIGTPNFVLFVHCQGQAGADPSRPEAIATIHAEFDMRRAVVGQPNLRDANFARIINWWEEGP